MISVLMSRPERHAMSVGDETRGASKGISVPIEQVKLNASGSETSTHEPAYRYRVWKALRVLRRDDIRFAIKVGVGAALYALPSFVPSTRPFYQQWRGEWGHCYPLMGSGDLHSLKTPQKSALPPDLQL